MAGALDELRRAFIAGETVDIDDTSITIGSNIRLDRSLPTNFHSMRGRGDPYLLESIFYQFRFRNMPYNDYVQACRREGVAHVTPLDKKDLLAFLTGEIDTCASIVSKPSDPSAVRSRAGKSTSAVRQTTADPSKRSLERGGKKVVSEVDKDVVSYSAQRQRDRDQRALDSVLMAMEWDFSTLREKLSQHVTNAKVGKNSTAENGSKSGAQATYDPRGDRYTSNEDRFWRENLGSEFHELGIDMSGSFKAKPSSNAANGPSVKQRDRRDTRPGSAKEPPSKRSRIDPKELVPIIIVPAGSTLICSGNAVEFFQNGHFISHEELKRKHVAAVSGSSRASAIRTPGGNCSKAEYLVVSNPNRLTSSEWDRVVAVLCSGQEWQFKNWPIHENGIQELFRKVQGFYFHYDDVAPTGNVESWAIKKLSLSRNKRHTDGQVQFQFWNTLDAFLRRKGKQLRY